MKRWVPAAVTCVGCALSTAGFGVEFGVAGALYFGGLVVVFAGLVMSWAMGGRS